jgi:hypothetical protein
VLIPAFTCRHENPRSTLKLRAKQERYRLYLQRGLGNQTTTAGQSKMTAPDADATVEATEKDSMQELEIVSLPGPPTCRPTETVEGTV